MSTRAIQITEMRLGISKLGVPLSGGYIRFKLAGTETLATVWQDKEKTLTADNPIQLDTNGRALVYADGILKLEVFDGDPAGSGTLLWTWDNQKYRAPNAQTSTKTANYTITPDDDMILGDATTGALTFTLQASANYVSPVFVKKIDASANNIVINPYSGETIDGNSSMSLTAQNETLHIFPDGSDWWSVKLTSVETAENSDTVDNIHASATAQPNKLLALNSSSKLPASITGDADTVDSHEANELAPPGKVGMFAMNTAPTGWLKCNGAAVSRTTYAELFAVIGTTYGVGDGSTTFNLPEDRGEFIRGWDDGRGVDSGRAFGSTQLDQMQTITGSFGGSRWISVKSASGAFSAGTAGSRENTWTDGAYSTNQQFDFNSSNSPGARAGSETRARNRAYLICIKY